MNKENEMRYTLIGQETLAVVEESVVPRVGETISGLDVFGLEAQAQVTKVEHVLVVAETTITVINVYV